MHSPKLRAFKRCGLRRCIHAKKRAHIKCSCAHQGSGMRSGLGSQWNPGTEFFKKSKKRSETRFGPLLMSSRRLVLFSGKSEHFFFVENVGHKLKRRFKKILTADPNGQMLSKSSSKDPPHHACKDRPINNIWFWWLPRHLFIPEPWCDDSDENVPNIKVLGWEGALELKKIDFF